MKTDTIFYHLFQSFPSIFFKLIGEHPSESLGYELISVEIGEISPTIKSIFLPAPGCHHKPIYFVEVEFQPNPDLYSSLFADLFLYLYLNHYPNDWRAVIVYPTRGMDVGETRPYRELLESHHVKRIYLDELGSTPQPSIGIETVQLVVEPEETAGTKARELIEQARLEIADEAAQQELIQLIERIISYKFPQKNREEIAQMLGLSDFRQTRVYQETAEEVKSEAVPRFLALGLSVEQIAQGLDLDVEQVRQAAVSHLLASGLSVEQVAETLSLDIDLVRQIEASNAESDKPTEE